MIDFINTYGNLEKNSKLYADKWNLLMRDLDISINNTTNFKTSPITITSEFRPSEDLTYNIPTDTETIHRGLIGRIGNVESTTSTNDLALVSKNNGILTQKVLGDRVRFGSWYIVAENLEKTACSHEFIEIVNSGTIPIKFDKILLSIYYTNNSEKKRITINLTGGINAQSSYLIRGKATNALNPTILLDKNYDIDISENLESFNLYNADAFVLHYNKFLPIVDGDYNLLISGTKIVNPYLVDAILFTGDLKLSNNTNIFQGNPVYTKQLNSIVKDLYALDPAKLAFRSLVECKNESTKSRSSEIALEVIPLKDKYFKFPHSKSKYDITNYTPKSSGLLKNILTDKTKPNFKKPNMVTCSFGIDASTTRCFNWISMGLELDEYVWIRKKGNTLWSNCFESYKLTESTINASNTLPMYRKEFNKDIINSVYARMHNIFPGDSSYEYTAHKCIIYILNALSEDDSPVVYEYIVGPSNELLLPVNDRVSNILEFTLYPTSWTPRVYHITDLLGFNWVEYQVWASAAEEINLKILKECTISSKLFPILINTGDMTQNGTRINEWLDYYNAGYSLFNHLEQMNVVGNNDLCNSVSEKFLGIGDDAGKSSPYYFHVFYCYEIPNDVTASGNWKGGLIYNNKYIPSMYYFYFGDYAYLMVNSELTETTCLVYFNALSGSGDSAMPINLYTGFKKDSAAALSVSTDGYLAKTLESWIGSLKEDSKLIIAACHEMPFTVTTADNLIEEVKDMDRSISASSKKTNAGGTTYSRGSLCGSHLNRISYTSEWDNDNNYWFSRLLLAEGIKLCIGGHKHTYAITYPVFDVTTAKTGVHVSKSAYIKVDSLITVGTSKDLWQTNSNLSNGVVYCMLQATGNKTVSNKELPSPNLNYSYIVPVTTYNEDMNPTPDNSLKYPMYATYSYNTNSIDINIYRIVNITTEVITDTVATVKPFNLISFSKNPMYSEKLVIRKGLTDVRDKNYWLVPDECKSYSPAFSKNLEGTYTLNTTLRCYNIQTNSGTKATILNNVEIELVSADYTCLVNTVNTTQ